MVWSSYKVILSHDNRQMVGMGGLHDQLVLYTSIQPYWRMYSSRPRQLVVCTGATRNDASSRAVASSGNTENHSMPSATPRTTATFPLKRLFVKWTNDPAGKPNPAASDVESTIDSPVVVVAVNCSRDPDVTGLSHMNTQEKEEVFNSVKFPVENRRRGQ